ncbi:Uncharacterized protein dnm_024200 [Desulfonema magnum]|uniref:Uncharacterized protein n=1 Tax=Desulfonema magnum TaxID=45655 RepID=A0A975GM02_9BACT|nr:Uncharacterized protein dnm_024200 [Desulfonema magnum]
MFSSANCGETRNFPSRTADHSGKKPGLFPVQISPNIWLDTWFIYL